MSQRARLDAVQGARTTGEFPLDHLAARVDKEAIVRMGRAEEPDDGRATGPGQMHQPGVPGHRHRATCECGDGAVETHLAERDATRHARGNLADEPIFPRPTQHIDGTTPGSPHLDEALWAPLFRSPRRPRDQGQASSRNLRYVDPGGADRCDACCSAIDLRYRGAAAPNAEPQARAAPYRPLSKRGA